MNITVQMTDEEYGDYRDYQLSVETKNVGFEQMYSELKEEHRKLCTVLCACVDYSVMGNIRDIMDAKLLQDAVNLAADWLNNDHLPF